MRCVEREKPRGCEPKQRCRATTPGDPAPTRRFPTGSEAVDAGDGESQSEEHGRPPDYPKEQIGEGRKVHVVENDRQRDDSSERGNHEGDAGNGKCQRESV